MLLHWGSDFVLQTDKQAKGKSSSNYWLTQHVGNYTAAMTLFLGCFLLGAGKFDIFTLAVFSVITFTCHWITDYFTSRLNKRLWEKGDVHNFFVSIGFDQWLHYVQLIITYKLLIG